MYDYDDWDQNDTRLRDEVWTVEMVAERWKCSGTKVREMLASGQLQGFKIGYTWRTYLSEIMKFENQPNAADHKRTISAMPKPVITRIV